MPADAARHVKAWERLWADAGLFRTNWQTLAEYLVPHKSNITQEQSPGVRQTDRLFDSTGPDAATTLAASIAGMLTPSTMKWASLVMRQIELNRIKAVRDWLEAVTDLVLAALNQSNFVTEAAELYLDIVAFGTGAIFVEEKPVSRLGTWAGLRFRALSIGSYVIAEDADGRVNVLYRRFHISAQAAIDEWGAEKVGEKITTTAKERPEELVTILHAITPRGYPGTPKVARLKPWASAYIHLDSKHLIREGGYDEFPAMVPRWAKTAGEAYGRGPAHTALPDIKTLNRAKELYLAAAAKALDPTIFMTDDGVTGSLSLEPAAINIARSKDDIWAFESQARFDVAALLTGELKRDIQQLFFVPVLRILKDKPQMTATEIIAIQEEMLRLLGPVAGRLHAEWLTPLIDRVVGIMARAGVLPPVPDVLRDVGGDIDVEYEGPLARAQKSVDLDGIRRWYTVMAEIAAATGSTEVFDNADHDEAARLAGQITGAPATIIRGQEQVADIRTTRQQAALMQQRLAAIGAAAEAAGKAAPMVKAVHEMQPETDMAGVA